MSFDFHFHSTYSDGSTSLEEVFETAKRKNLRAIAVTDHDTALSFPELKRLSREYKIPYIPALELTVLVQGVKLHVLAYGLYENSQELEEYSLKLMNYMDERSRKQIRILQDSGVDIPEEEYFKQSKGGPLYRAKLLYTLAQYGYLEEKDIMSSLSKYFGKNAPCYLEDAFEYMDFETGCEFIKRNGGIVVLAHPGKIKKKSEELYRKLINSPYLDGLEVYHTDNNEEVRKELRDIAKKNSLRITGGSDHHGKFRKVPIDIGGMELPEEVYSSLKDLISNSYL